MKKNIRHNKIKSIFSILGLSIVCSFFSVLNYSCKNEPIFAAIEEEVKLKKQSIQGSILGIIKIGNTVYCANPKNLFKKGVGILGTWETIALPGGMCVSIATDGTDLYANMFEGGTYVYKAGSWQVLSSPERIHQIVSGKSIIGINESNKVYILNGTNFVKLFDSNGKDITLTSTLMGGGGRYFADKNHLYSYSGSVATQLPLSDLIKIKDVCQGDDKDKVFVLTSSALFHYDGSSLTSIKHQISSPWSLCYSKEKAVILVGGSQGYKEVTMGGSYLDGSSVRLPGSTGSTVPHSCYNQYNNSVGKWLLRPMNLISTPSGYIIYAGVGGGEVKYTGLWGFYNPGQLEWNRE